jgi:proline iminopeptidase
MNKTKNNKTKKNKTRKLYTYNLSKQIEAGYLQVSNLHSIYYSYYGNKNGIPLLVIHGGPGGSSSSKKTTIYNPKKYFIVLVDQRGCGKSKPFGELRENNTDELIKDFEKLRKHLHIKKWILCGGSWGSTLALVYAIRHPSVVRKMFISGIFLGDNSEIHNVQGNNGQFGTRSFFPKAYEEYSSFIPKKEQSNLLKAYMRRFQGKLGKTIKNKAHMKWSLWEKTISSVRERSNKTMKNKLKLNNVYKTLSMIECHYFLKNCFLSKDYILKNCYKIKHIPTYIIQGHYDLICYPIYAYNLHKALPKSKLFFTNGGHSDIDKSNKKTKYDVLKKYG